MFTGEGPGVHTQAFQDFVFRDHKTGNTTNLSALTPSILTTMAALALALWTSEEHWLVSSHLSPACWPEIKEPVRKGETATGVGGSVPEGSGGSLAGSPGVSSFRTLSVFICTDPFSCLSHQPSCCPFLLPPRQRCMSNNVQVTQTRERPYSSP